MKLKTWQYIFKELNKFGGTNGSYILSIDENNKGILVTAKSTKSKETRIIMIEKRKVL